MTIDKVIAVNRAARHDYDILEIVEAGLVLTGTEIKSVREGRVNIKDAYARGAGGELWLYNAHIPKYASASYQNHEPLRTRKLLLHRGQLRDLSSKAQQKGLTIVPLRLYIKNHVAKVELGLAKGRRKYDKREAIAKRDVEREMAQAMKRPTRSARSFSGL